ncbi:Sterol-binding domain protein [Aspergillus oryzae]|nr:Sterol-binding domain protein [Aspergillus oryzae]
MSDFRADGYYDSWSSNLNKASPEKRQGLVHKHRTLYEIIVKKGSEQSTIFINLKRGEGEITRSTSDHADVIATIGDDDLIHWIQGSVNGQRLFMLGKLKVKAKQQAPTHHRIATHARGKEGSCELTKEERIISTPTSNQDAIIVAYIAIVLANHSNRDKITSNHDMVLLEPGLARDAELGTLGLRGDDEAIIVVPEDGRVTLGANIESMKAPGLSTYPMQTGRGMRTLRGNDLLDHYSTGTAVAPSESGCWSSRVGHMDGRRLGEYKSPDGSTMTANGDCITHIKPRCDSGILLNSDCVVGNPSTPDGTDHRDQNCVSRELPKCTEEGYEWSELEKQCRKKGKTECLDGYREENGQCVSGDVPDCGKNGTLEGKDCIGKKEPTCSDDTYWDGEDCRSPDEPNCGEGKRFKK